MKLTNTEMDKLIVEGLLVNHNTESYGQVEINTITGLIERIGERLGKPDLVAKGCLVFPGFIDVHVHAREDVSGKQNYKEDYLTASAAAINGGVVAFADMPNNPVPPVDDVSFRAKQKLSQKLAVDVVLYAGIGPNTRPLSFPAPYKVYIGKSVGELFFNSRQELEKALSRYRGQNVSFHCEDPEILAKNQHQPTHELRRPREAEISAIDFALELMEKYQLTGKICHLSTETGLRKIKQAKANGLAVTCEAAPHHLYFDQSNKFQINPPLRRPEDRFALLEGLRAGDIDYLASDHAPHSKEERQQGVSGLPHLDTYGSFVAWLIKEQNFQLQDIARICSYNPAGFINQFLSRGSGQGFGRIEQGFLGSLSILDMNRPFQISSKNLKTKCGWSPFEAKIFPGRVKYAIIRGKIYEV